MKVEVTALLLVCVISNSASADSSRPVVNTVRVPNGGIQPQLAVGDDGRVHMLYYKGEAGAGDIYYVTSTDDGQSFSDPMRVNSQPRSAIAAGTIRGARLVLGKHDRVHVSWNGSGEAEPKGLPNPQAPKDSPYRFSSPMLYARMKDDGTGFEPQRNLMTSTYALDGGGSVAADDDGRVYVVWHANSTTGKPGEEGRAVWVVTSEDDGETFSTERRTNQEPTGACGCCSLQASTDQIGNLFVLYRSAEDTVHRNMYVLISRDRGRSFSLTKLDNWDVGQCVMSSASLLGTSDGMLAAWETEHQVKFGRISHDLQSLVRHTPAPAPSEETRKHPVLGVNSNDHVILAWTEGTGWQKGGSVAWQVFDQTGQPIPDAAGKSDGVPIWGFAAVLAGKNDEFTVVY